MNSGYAEILESIRQKTARLNAAYQHHKRINNELTKKIDTINQENTELKAEIQRLNNELETLKLTSSLNKGGESNKEAEGQINNLIREIDQCITLINRL